MTSTPRAGTVATAQPGWRFWVALGVWTAVILGFVLGLMSFGRMLGLGLGIALGAEPAIDEQVGVWWSFVAIAIGLAVAAVAAAVVRRWVACVLALVIVAGCAFFAFTLFASVRAEVSPVPPFEHVDPGPPPCACYSGSFCDCAGG